MVTYASLNLAFAGRERIHPRATETDICASVSINHVIASPTNNAVITTETVDCIYTRTTQNQIVPSGAGHRSGSTDYAREIQACTSGRFDAVR